MKRIFKYGLEMDYKQIVRMPAGAQVLHVGEQQGDLFIWAIVDDEEKATHNLSVMIIGTGNKCDVNQYKHLGTVITQAGMYVWHVFVPKDTL